MGATVRHQTYSGHAVGIVYDVFQSESKANTWTLVVCEDRPQVYQAFLRRLVEEDFVGCAMSIPFCEAGRHLLQDGEAVIGGILLKIKNTRQCCLVLDMDASEGGCDLEGIDATTLAFAGASFFSTLPRHIREKTALWSRSVPLPGVYYERYPELQLANQKTFMKASDFADGATGLSDDSASVIQQFVEQIRQQFDVYLFEPVGNGMVRIAFGGWGPLDFKGRKGAKYLYYLLKHAGQTLDTARIYSLFSDAAAYSGSISREDFEDSAPTSGLSITVQGLDELGVKNVCKEIENELHQVFTRIQDSLPDDDEIEEMVPDSPLTRRIRDLKQMIAGNVTSEALRTKIVNSTKDAGFDEVQELLKAVSNSRYKVRFEHDGEKWRVSAVPFNRNVAGLESGEKITYKPSETIRKGVIRFVQEDVRPKLPLLAAHLLGDKPDDEDAVDRTLELSAHRQTCEYKGQVPWDFGDDACWRVDPSSILWQPGH